VPTSIRSQDGPESISWPDGCNDHLRTRRWLGGPGRSPRRRRGEETDSLCNSPVRAHNGGEIPKSLSHPSRCTPASGTASAGSPGQRTSRQAPATFLSNVIAPRSCLATASGLDKTQPAPRELTAKDQPPHSPGVTPRILHQARLDVETAATGTRRVRRHQRSTG
jgi:hypothetical protein